MFQQVLLSSHAQQDDVPYFTVPTRTSSTFKGRWTEEEHEQFLRGVDEFGKDWVAIHEFYVITRTETQIRTHAQKYFQKEDAGAEFPCEVRRKDAASDPDERHCPTIASYGASVRGQHILSMS